MRELLNGLAKRLLRRECKEDIDNLEEPLVSEVGAIGS